MQDQMSSDELAALFGCSAETIREMTRRHVLAKVDGKFPVAELVRRALAHHREVAAARGGKLAEGVAKERAALLAVQRKRAEHAFEREFGEWISAQECARQWTHRFSGIKAAITALPTRLNYLDYETLARLTGDLREFLNEVADGRYDTNDDPDAKPPPRVVA